MGTLAKDSAQSMGIGDYASQLSEMSGPEFAAYTAGEKAKHDIGKEYQAQAEKRAQSQIMADYGSTLFSKPAPHFAPSQEDMSGFAALGSLLAVSGAMMGMKGKTSGIMAMNAISGMMKGYQQGRKDLYEQERQKFEMSMKDWERERSQIKEAFDMALKMAPTNYKGAVEFLNKTLASIGAEVPRASLQRNGLMPTVNTFGPGLENSKKTVEAIGAKTGFTPQQALTAQQRIVLAEEAARREAQSKVDTGALEWVKKPDGTVDRMTKKEVDAARAKGVDIQYVATPTSKTTTPADKDYVKARAQRIANYLDKPLSAWERRQPEGQEIEKILARDYPKYDEKKFATQTAAQKAFATGKEATTARSLEVVFDHVETLQALNAARNAGDIQKFNKLAAEWGAQFGATAPTNFETAVSLIGSEIAKAIGGSGTAQALTDREEARNAFDLVKTPEQVDGAIAVVKRLVGGQLKGVGNQYERTTGDKFSESNILPDYILQEMNWQSRIFKDGKGEKRSDTTTTTSTSDAKSTAPKEGDTDVSKSGKPIIFRNGKWEYQ